jgi:tubulin--tyrosine ligase
MKEYFDMQGLNVFNVMPMTFHVRGIDDPEFTRFMEYYFIKQNHVQEHEEKRSALLLENAQAYFE